MIVTGGLERGNKGFVGNTGRTVFGWGGFGHDDLIIFGRDSGKLAKVIISQKIIGSTDAGSDTATINTNSIEAKTVGSGGIPDSRSAFSTSGTDITRSIRNSNTDNLGERVVFGGHNLIAVAGGSSNSNNVGGGGSDAGGQKAKINRQIVDGKRKFIKGVVDVFESGFENKTGGVIGTRGILTNIVG